MNSYEYDDFEAMPWYDEEEAYAREAMEAYACEAMEAYGDVADGSCFIYGEDTDGYDSEG